MAILLPNVRDMLNNGEDYDTIVTIFLAEIVDIIYLITSEELKPKFYTFTYSTKSIRNDIFMVAKQMKIK
jgi:hypothetical protein